MADPDVRVIYGEFVGPDEIELSYIQDRTDANPCIFSQPGCENNQQTLPENFASNPALKIILVITIAIKNRIRIRRTLTFFFN